MLGDEHSIMVGSVDGTEIGFGLDGKSWEWFEQNGDIELQTLEESLTYMEHML